MPRKPIALDLKQVERLAEIGCTDQEIAHVLGVSEAHVQRRAREALNKGRAQLRQSLRRKQIELAKKGSVPMLIWLGKQYLGQRDRQDVSYSKEKLKVVERIVAEDSGADSSTG